jgi:hypothetical protein
MVKRNSRWAIVAFAFVTAGAQASFHTFRIDQIYSNTDGSVQYVVLKEAQGASGQNLWGGRQFTTTNAARQNKQITFPSNLPSTSTAQKSVLLATAGFAALGLVTPDYTIPARFIPPGKFRTKLDDEAERAWIEALRDRPIAVAQRNARRYAAHDRPESIGRVNTGEREAVRAAQRSGGHRAHEREIAHARFALVPVDARIADRRAIDRGLFVVLKPCHRQPSAPWPFASPACHNYWRSRRP